MSEWRESANRRRNARQTIPLAIRKPGGSKRDTKRWCRGVIGREHKPSCKDYGDVKRWDFKGWKVLVCDACGKHLDHYYPSPFDKTPAPPPAWAVV